MSLGAPGERYPIPEDPIEKAANLARAGLRPRKGLEAFNEKRTFSPEKDQRRREAAASALSQMQDGNHPPEAEPVSTDDIIDAEGQE
jgi:hypothetical protein